MIYKVIIQIEHTNQPFLTKMQKTTVVRKISHIKAPKKTKDALRSFYQKST